MKMVLVRSKDYNGYENVLFMMDGADFRLTDALFCDNYQVLEQGVFDRKRRLLLTESGKQFDVWEDWSLTAVY